MNLQGMKIVIEQNDRREEYVAVYTNGELSGKVYAPWQVAMVKTYDELCAKVANLEDQVKFHKTEAAMYLREVYKLSPTPTLVGSGSVALPEVEDISAQTEPVPKLLLNRAECKQCGSVITSTHRHDFVECMCGAIFVDGGLDYVRRGGDMDAIIELSKWEEKDAKSD